jgi:hypothetical protein
MSKSTAEPPHPRYVVVGWSNETHCYFHPWYWHPTVRRSAYWLEMANDWEIVGSDRLAVAQSHKTWLTRHYGVHFMYFIMDTHAHGPALSDRVDAQPKLPET